MGFIQWNTVCFLFRNCSLHRGNRRTKVLRVLEEENKDLKVKLRSFLLRCAANSEVHSREKNTKFAEYVGLTLKRQPRQATARCKLWIPQLLFEAEYPPHSTYSQQAQSGTSPGGYCMIFPQCETIPSYVNL